LQIALSLNSKSGLTIGQTILQILGVRRFLFVVSVDNTLSVELIGYAGMPNVSCVLLGAIAYPGNEIEQYTFLSTDLAALFNNKGGEI
jgi:hypothetical protein